MFDIEILSRFTGNRIAKGYEYIAVDTFGCYIGILPTQLDCKLEPKSEDDFRRFYDVKGEPKERQRRINGKLTKIGGFEVIRQLKDFNEYHKDVYHIDIRLIAVYDDVEYPELLAADAVLQEKLKQIRAQKATATKNKNKAKA